MPSKLPIRKRRKEEKCLVTEAMDKCQCEMCKLFREMRDFNLKMIIQDETRRILHESIEEVEKKCKKT